MKRIFCFALCLLGGWSLSMAQSDYKVKACDGNVTYKPIHGTEWRAVTVNQVLTSTDSVRIQSSGSVRIHYGDWVYSMSSPGKTTVYDIVTTQRAERANHFTTKGLLREIGTDETQPFQMAQVGAGGARGTGKDIDYEALADQLTWIGAQACTGNKSPIVKGVTFRRNKLSNGDWEFEFENKSGKELYINILHVNKRDKTLSLCYVITPEIKQNAYPMTPSGFCSCAMDISL